MNTSKVATYRAEISKERAELERLSLSLISLLQTVDIEYIDFYSIINQINNHTTIINKLEYLIALEYQ